MSTSKLASVLEKKIQQFESRADNGGSDPEVVEMFANMRTWLEEDADIAFYDFEVTHEGIEIEVPRLKTTVLIYYQRVHEHLDGFYITLKGSGFGHAIFIPEPWPEHDQPKSRWTSASREYPFEKRKSYKEIFFEALNKFFEEMPLGEIA